MTIFILYEIMIIWGHMSSSPPPPSKHPMFLISYLRASMPWIAIVILCLSLESPDGVQAVVPNSFLCSTYEAGIIKNSRSSYKNIKHTKDYQPKNSEIKGIPIPMAFHHSDRFPRRRIYKAPFCLAIQRDSQRFTKLRLAQSSTRRPKLMTCTLTHSHSIRRPRGNAFAQVAFR